MPKIHVLHSTLAPGGVVRRRLVLMCAALAAAIALLSAVATVHASPASAHVSAAARSASLFDKSWTVKFRNSYGKHVDVAFMRFNPGMCNGEGGWEVKGWFGLEPGELKSVFSTSHPVAAYYAEAVDGHRWGGDRISAYVTDDAFDNCRNVASTASQKVDMAKIDLPDMSFPTLHVDYTINLIP